MRKEKIFSLPSGENSIIFLQWFSIVLSCFLIVYYSCNSYAASLSNHYHLYMDWELSIPLVPPMIIIYITYVFIFALVPLVFKSPMAFRALACSMLAIIGTSGVIFVLFPWHLGFIRQDSVPEYQFIFSLLYAIDQPHNLFPSLHVTFACICVLALIHQTSNRQFHFALKIWFLLVCVSVILVHQHHFFDVISGITLGWVVYKSVYLKVVNKLILSQPLISETFKAFNKLRSLGNR